jgi:hypothetical protein
MAAKISAEEKETATLVPLDRILSDIDDTEAAFNDFRESFHTGEEPGVVRAWELLIDERGNIGTTRTQTRLGSWPVDAYTMDELCKLLIDQYMTPDQQRMAVRLVGTDPKKTGYVFNKIVMLKRSLKKESSSNGSESTASIMKMMQENNERIMAMMQRLQAPKEEKDVMAEINKMMAFSQAMNAPMMAMLQSFLPALAGRPAPTTGTDPFGSLDSLLNVAERISDMRGGGGGESGDDNSFAGILRAITPLAKPALEALPAIAAMSAARPKLAAPAPAAPRPAAPGSVPTAAPVSAGILKPQPAPAAPMPNIQPTDIPSGDSAMLAQLKPQIDSLVEMAAAGSEPVGAADLIFDQVFLDPNLPEEIFQKLAGFVDSPTFVNYVIVMNPAAKPHAAWFESFKTQIVKRMNAETESIDSPSQPGPIANG